jgi:hypothetical protein
MLVFRKSLFEIVVKAPILGGDWGRSFGVVEARAGSGFGGLMV